MPARSLLMSTYLPQPVAFERGDGAHLFDAGGTRTKPGTSGSKPFCTFTLPVAERVASERP